MEDKECFDVFIYTVHTLIANRCESVQSLGENSYPFTCTISWKEPLHVHVQCTFDNTRTCTFAITNVIQMYIVLICIMHNTAETAQTSILYCVQFRPDMHTT